MKYNNQSMFNGHQITNVVDRPVLHKKGKQWITVGLSTLLLAGLGTVATVNTSANADSVNNTNAQQNIQSKKPATNTKSAISNISNQANTLHNRIVNNNALYQHNPSASATDISSKASVSAKSNASQSNNSSVSSNVSSVASSNVESVPEIKVGNDNRTELLKSGQINNTGFNYEYYRNNQLHIYPTPNYNGTISSIGINNKKYNNNLDLPKTQNIIIDFPNLSTNYQNYATPGNNQPGGNHLIDVSHLRNLQSIKINSGTYNIQGLFPSMVIDGASLIYKSDIPKLYPNGSAKNATNYINTPAQETSGNVPKGTWYTSSMITPTYNYNDWFTNKSIKSNIQGNQTATPNKALDINQYDNKYKNVYNATPITKGSSTYTQFVLPTDIVNQGSLKGSQTKYVIDKNRNMKVGSGALTKSDITSLYRVINDNKVNSINFVSNNGNPNDSTSLNNKNNKDKVSDLSKAFANNSDLKSINFGNSFDTSNVNHMMGMFANDKNLNTITFGNKFNTMKANQPSDLNDSNISWIKSWKTDTKNVNGELGMFANDNKLQTLNGSNNNTKFASDALKNQNDNISAPQNWVNSNNQPIELFSANAPALSFTAKATTPVAPKKQTTNNIEFEDNGQTIKSGTISGNVNDVIKDNASDVKDQMPDNYKLANSDATFKLASDNGQPDNAPEQVVNVVSTANNNIPVSDNAVNMNGNIYLHYENKNGTIVTKRIPYNAQSHYDKSSNINLLNYVHASKPSDFKGKTIDISGQPFNATNFNVDSNKGNNNNYIINVPASDYNYYHGSTTDYTKDLNLYFEANGNTDENVQYTINNQPKGNPFIVSGSDNTVESAESVSAKSAVPSGYSIANPSSAFTINGGTVDIPLVESQASRRVHFNGGPNNASGSTKSGNYNSDVQPSDINNIPNGYHLASNAVSPNTHFGGNSDINVNIAPNTEHEVINYYYHNNSGQNILAGVSYATGSFGSSADINSSNESGLDNGYQLVNKDNNYTYGNTSSASSNGDNYGNGFIDVSVQPKSEATTINFEGPDSNGSNSNRGSFVAHNPNPNYPDNNVAMSDIIKNLPQGYKLKNNNVNIPYSKQGTTNVDVVPDMDVNNQSVMGKAYITLNYHIKGTNHYSSKVVSVGLNGHLNDMPQYISPWNQSFMKQGYVPNASDANDITVGFDKKTVDANDNGDYARYNRYFTFNYTATPVDVAVQYVDKDNKSSDFNKPIKLSNEKTIDDLGNIGLEGQTLDLKNNPNSDARLNINGHAYTLNVPSGYHLVNEDNDILVSANDTVSQQQASANSSLGEEAGQPMMLLTVPMNMTANKPATPNKPASSANNNNNKPANNNGGSVSPANIPNTPNIPNIPSQPSDNINPIHFSDNNNPIIPNDNININIPSSSANNGSKASSASASNNNVAPASNKNSDNIFIPNSDVKPARHYNIKRVNNVNDIKIGQTANYHGLKITNITNKIHYFYVYNIKGIQLHHNLFKVGKENKRAVSVSAKRGFTGRILRYLRVNGKLRYEVRHNHKNYFVTANPKFVRNAYYQPREFKRATHGLLPHVRIQLRKNAYLYNNVHYSKHTRVGILHKGKKATVTGIRKIGRKGYQQTRLVLSNGLIITANKNYVKFV